MVRVQSGVPVTGRPPEFEQEQIAAGVGALLRQMRRDQGMGIRDLEARSGVNRSTISRIESGLRRPRRSVLAWLAWGLDAESVGEVTARLCEAAGDSLVAESPWSERMHARKAARQLERGTMPVPMALLAPRAVAALGGMIPDDLERLRQAEEMARRGLVPWPPGMNGSPEALAVADALMRMTPSQLVGIGRGAANGNDYGAVLERRRRKRARRAIEREAFATARRIGRSGKALADALMAADAAGRRK